MKEQESYKLDARNARKHPDRNKVAVERSLRELGAGRSIVVDKHGVVIGGNAVYEQAQKLGIPVHEVETTGDQLVVVRRVDLDTDDPKRKALALADNQISLLAEWDDEVLGEIQHELIGEFDIEVMGFDKITGTMDPIEDEDAAAEMVDRAEELREKWGTENGQLWVIGSHRLLCGDSTKAEDVGRVMDGASINIAFTSPPYASQRKYDESSGFKPIPPSDYVAWWEPIQAHVRKHLAADGSFFVNIKEAASDGVKQAYVKRLVLEHIDKWEWLWIDEYCWPRPALPLNPNTSRRFKNGWESVFHFTVDAQYKFKPDDVRHKSDGCFDYDDQKAAGKMICDGGQGMGGGAMSPVNTHKGLAYPSNVLANMGGAKVVGHAAAFPVGLPSFFIRAYSDETDTVYDPFIGSGTTLIAAEQLGRKCYGIEISPAYCAVVLERATAAGLTAELVDGR